MNNDLEGSVGWHLPGPPDDVLLGLSVEILLTKWKRIKRMEELRDPIDADFDLILRRVQASAPYRPTGAASESGSPCVTRRSLARHIRHRQWESRRGSGGFDNMLLVAPPRTNSLNRECP